MGRSRAQQQAKFNKRVDDAKNDLNAGTIKNIREAAEVHGIAYSSLRDRLAGAKNRQEAHVEQQNLTPVEENAIKKWILKLDDWGFPPKHQYVKDISCDFLRSHGIPRRRTYSQQTIASAFKSTGIYPLNPRQVLGSSLTKAKTHAAEKAELLIPRTPHHGKRIATHTKWTPALMGGAAATPDRVLAKIMVEKLSLAAAENAAEVIILKQELEYLRKKNKAAVDSSKVKSKAVLSKVLVVTTEEVVRLRTQWEEKQSAATLKSEQRTARAAAKLEAKGSNSSERFTKQKALPSTPGQKRKVS
ncbi:uncharacterized protein H6S33_007069 [Morchella sextelata]|uniref:uncharacterized protein n=1 Tax=Morchella sextelata TaxID=1174677 RepID=UPI001D057B86|nr:uncharacterized protein H6S33_007069 [Morchella sextelata]KAH0604038.1 hypothetical protein H6S33_007069 [Morchella sextelata]